MSNNRNHMILPMLLISLWLLVLRADALRVSRPEAYSLPWDGEQMKKHNQAHEDVWNLQNGEFNLDIVTTTKTRAGRGDFWLIQTGNIVYLQYKALDKIFTITPD